MRRQAILLALMLLAVIGVVYAAFPTCTIDAPATGATVAAAITANVTLSATTDLQDNETLINCTWNVWSSATANSSSSAVAMLVTDTNITANSSFTHLINTTLNVTYYEDSDNYNVKVTCVGNNSRSCTDTNTGIRINNGVPTMPSTVLPAADTKDTDGDMTFSAAVAGNETTDCTLVFSGTNPGSGGYVMTHSGDTCTVSLTGIPNSVYDWYIAASDKTDITNSAVRVLTIDQPKVSPGAKAAIASGIVPAESGQVIGGTGGGIDSTLVVLVALGGLAIWYFVLRKK